MDELIRSRILLLIEEKKTNANALARIIGVKQKTLYNQLYKDAPVSSASIIGILFAYPDVSAEWITRGKEPKYLADDKQPISNASPVGYINSPGAHHNNNTVIGSPGALAVGSSAEEENKIEELQAKLEDRDSIITERDARIHALEAELSQVRSENSKLVEANYKLIMGK